MSKSHKCKRCGLAFSSKKGLNNHSKDKHRSYYYSIRVTPISIVAVVLLVAAYWLWSNTYNNLPPDDVWDVALPVVTENGLSSDSVELSSIKGKPALLEFMVSWCGHCKNMAPRLEEMYGKYGGSVTFMTIAGTWGDANADSTAEFIRETHTSWTHVLDQTNTVFNAFDVSSTPTYLFFNSKGELVQRMSGEVSEERLVSELESLG